MISTNEINFYNSHGYLILKSILDKYTINKLTSVANIMLEDYKNKPKHFSLKIDTSHKGKNFLANKSEQYPDLDQFIKGDFIKSIVKPILGEKIFLYNEQLVNKEPNTESNFSWHQDSGYSPDFEHQPYLSIWIALTKTTIQNGALRLIPVNLNNGVEVENHIWSDISQDLVMNVEESDAITCEVEEGDIVAFSSRTPHSSYPNKTNKNRIAYLCQYTCEKIAPAGYEELRGMEI